MVSGYGFFLHHYSFFSIPFVFFILSFIFKSLSVYLNQQVPSYQINNNIKWDKNLYQKENIQQFSTPGSPEENFEVGKSIFRKGWMARHGDGCRQGCDEDTCDKG